MNIVTYLKRVVMINKTTEIKFFLREDLNIVAVVEVDKSDKSDKSGQYVSVGDTVEEVIELLRDGISGKINVNII